MLQPKGQTKLFEERIPEEHQVWEGPDDSTRKPRGSIEILQDCLERRTL